MGPNTCPPPPAPRGAVHPHGHVGWEPQSRGSQHFMTAEPLDVLPGWMQEETL